VRLCKDAILMSARILVIIDSYDAMTSYRPYREALSIAEAKAELRCCAGHQCDPVVVEVFQSILDEQRQDV